MFDSTCNYPACPFLHSTQSRQHSHMVHAGGPFQAKPPVPSPRQILSVQSYQKSASEGLLLLESQGFCAAGVLLCRLQSSTQCVEVLLGLDLQNKYDILGGKREGVEEPLATALREFHEETGKLFSGAEVKALREVVRKDADVLWVARPKFSPKFALYLLLCHDTTVLGAAANLPKRYTKWYNSFWRRSSAEMSALEWIPLADIALNSGKATQFCSKLASIRQCAVFQQWVQQCLSQAPRKFSDPVVSFITQVTEERQSADAEWPGLVAEIQQLSAPSPNPEIPQDIVALDAASAEFKSVVSALPNREFVSVKKVDVARRQRVFDAYCAALPPQHRGQLRTYHGTPTVPGAHGIARRGPDLSITTNGRAYGQGFYTAASYSTPRGYAGAHGAVCLCTVAPGRTKSNGSPTDTAASLANEPPPGPYDSVACNGDWHVIMHPDAVVVNYIVEIGADAGDAAHEDELRRHALWEQQEQVRELLLERARSRLKMIEHFRKACDHLLHGAAPAHTPFHGAVSAHSRVPRMHLFQREVQQFHDKDNRGLPLYAYKPEFLALLHDHSAIALKAGTGTGKTVLVAQWVYDHGCFARGREKSRVAVVVPRKGIAEGLAKYVSKVRGCEVGEAVGYGTGDAVVMSHGTALCFMTYGFFGAITTRCTNFDTWSAVVLDEAHERHVEADVILAQLGRVCRARAGQFWGIVMSATMDVDKFVGFLEVNGAPSCGRLEVPGATFPVEEVWPAQGWEADGPQAQHNLAIEVLKIVNHEEGNVLVFVSTTFQVDSLVTLTEALVKHRQDIVVRGLYAALPAGRRREIEDFVDLEQFPEHKGKQLVCYATNVAESGITIHGLSAVVETGRELQVTYDQLTKTTRCTEAWISRSSHLQRRGRVGRTGPGRCYNMFTREQYEGLPEDRPASVHHVDLTPHLLRLAAKGLPTLDLPEAPCGERTAVAYADLQKLGAVDESHRITALGRQMACLPVSPALARCIVHAATLGVSEEVAAIACLTTVRSGAVFTKEAGQKTNPAAQFFAPSGDHETMLNVFEAWRAAGKSASWCHQHQVSDDVMVNANHLLHKVHRSMTQADIPIRSMAPEHPGRSRRICKALCSGHTAHTAVALNPQAPRDGFHLTEGYTFRPVTALAHARSPLLAMGTDVQTVIFHSKSESPKGVTILNLLTKVETAWVEEVALGQDDVLEVLWRMRRETFAIPVDFLQVHSACRNALTGAILRSLDYLRSEFPKGIFKLNAPQIFVSCLSGEQTTIRRRVQEVVDASSPHCKAIHNINGLACSVFKKHVADGLAKQLTARFGVPFVNITADPLQGTVTVQSVALVFDHIFAGVHKHLCSSGRIVGVSKKGVVALIGVGGHRIKALKAALQDDKGSLGIEPAIWADSDTGAVQVAHPCQTFLKHCLQFVHAQVHEGTVHMDPNIPVPVWLTPEEPGCAPTAQYDHTDEKLRVQFLQKPAADIRLLHSLQCPMRERYMLLMAHHIQHDTPMYVYGGFIRDYVVGGRVEPEGDLDVGINTFSVQEALADLITWAAGHDIKNTYQQQKGPHVLEVIFQVSGGATEFPVELVDTQAFAKQDRRVDFDVNNLKLQPVPGVIALKVVRADYPPLDTVLSNCRNRVFCVLKNEEEVLARILKMKRRGWRLIG